MKEITLDATIENIAQVTAFIDEELENLNCSMKAMMQIDVAIDEIFGNIARYAYTPNIGKATVQLDFDAESRNVTITFIDQGIPHNPLNFAEPDVTLSAEERTVGGLGIFLVRKTMDDVRYSDENGMNHFSIIKKI